MTQGRRNLFLPLNDLMVPKRCSRYWRREGWRSTWSNSNLHPQGQSMGSDTTKVETYQWSQKSRVSHEQCRDATSPIISEREVFSRAET